MDWKRIGTVSALLFMCFCLTVATAWGYQYETYYDDKEGLTVDVVDMWEGSDTDATPLYGQPFFMDGPGLTNILYIPANFFSFSSGGATDDTNGTLTMTLRAKDFFAINKVTIAEVGGWEFTGNGSADTNASYSGTFSGGTESATLSAGPYNDNDNPDDGDFFTNGELDFSGQGLTEVTITLENFLHTESETGTSARIEKELISESVEVVFYTQPVPIPGAAWLLGSGLLAVIGIRRRNHD
jgi:hypothetical protein